MIKLYSLEGQPRHLYRLNFFTHDVTDIVIHDFLHIA